MGLAVFDSTGLGDHEINPGTDDSGTPLGIAASCEFGLGHRSNAHAQLIRTVDCDLGEAVSDLAVAESAEESGSILREVKALVWQVLHRLIPEVFDPFEAGRVGDGFGHGLVAAKLTGIGKQTV